MSDEQQSPTDADTESTSEGTGSDTDLESGAPGDVGDGQLPEDLQPGEDNPLARHPDQTGDEDDQIGADREEEPETAPLHSEDADYGSGAGGGGNDSAGSKRGGGGDGPQDGRADAEEDDGSAQLDHGGGGAG